VTGQPSGVKHFDRHALHEVAVRDLVSTTYRATSIGPAERPVASHLVALRVVGDGFADRRDAVDRFLHANGEVSAIDHPHVLRVIEIGRQRSRPYVASVWRDGMPLEHLLGVHAPLPVWVVLRLGGQLAEALDALHGHGIVHGTVGVRSVWIKSRRRGQPSVSAAVTAFGTGHLLGAALRNAGDADAASDVFCVAPEQVRDGRTDPLSDQYSLACLLFMALTGAPPFAAPTNKALFRAHASSAPPLISDLRPDLDAAWDEVFGRALDKDPGARFENCRTLVREAGRCAPPGDRGPAPPSATDGPAAGAGPVAGDVGTHTEVAERRVSGEQGLLADAGSAAGDVGPAAGAGPVAGDVGQLADAGSAAGDVGPVAGGAGSAAGAGPSSRSAGPGAPPGRARRPWLCRTLVGLLVAVMVVLVLLAVSSQASAAPAPTPDSQWAPSPGAGTLR
jgi:serine/threonine-protein kinase